MTETINNQLVLISGESGTGKSACLQHIPEQEKWIYANCEAGKRLPFRNKFKTSVVTDPYTVYALFDYAMESANGINGIIIDTATFLMEMYESVYIHGSSNTQGAWGDYFQFFKNLMQDKVAKLQKPVLILAHTKREYNEKKLDYDVAVPVKGALKNNGIEAYFSTVVSTKRLELTALEGYESELLTITDEERELGYKHVFQTKPTKATVGERIRSPMGMFTKAQTFMDNDAYRLLKHMDAYYAG